MIRLAFIFLSAVLLVLSLASTALWARSQWTPDRWDAGYFQLHPHPRYPAFTNGKRLTLVNADGKLTAGWFEIACIGGPGHKTRTLGEKGEQWVYVAPGDRREVMLGSVLRPPTINRVGGASAPARSATAAR